MVSSKSDGTTFVPDKIPLVMLLAVGPALCHRPSHPYCLSVHTGSISTVRLGIWQDSLAFELQTLLYHIPSQLHCSIAVHHTCVHGTCSAAGTGMQLIPC
jgi:hypothetical protein